MKIGFIGYGEMGQAISAAITGRAGSMNPPPEILISTAHHPNTAAVARQCRTIFLCVRPAQAADVAKELKPLLTEKHTLISILAGKRLATLRKLFGTRATIIRAMPNLGVKVGIGMVAITDGRAGAPRTPLKRTQKLLKPVGHVMILPERQFDAFTALAGSGPAWTAAFLQAQIAAAGKLGIKPMYAFLYVIVTMVGTLRYLTENEPDLPSFIRQVATPGGTTAAGMAKLADGRFDAAITEALAACAARAKELGR